MLLLVVAGTVVAGGVGLFLLEVVVDGVLQDPFARAFTAVAQGLFGQTEEAALALYQTYIRNNKTLIINLGMMALMLVAFYLAMGRFTRWLDQVGHATRQMVEDSSKPISLPGELQPMEEDLKAIQAQLRAREDAARESDQRKNDLIAFLAHDLKTPLTSVVGYLTLLRAQPDLDRAERIKYTGIALDKAERLEELLGEFFDITRMELKLDENELVPIQLSMLLEQLTDEFYPLFAEKDLRCETTIAHHLVVRGDPDKLARVFDNVLRNAVNYSTPGGVVELRAEEADGRVEITVRNEGLEIPEGELANIFRKFYRLDAARSSRTGGAGLGLAIAKEIVELHGGTIRAESNGKFTSFIISLPVLREGSGDWREN
ncbi:MAG TPA: HAMP domain-containing histidine kinase [Candidatus Galloscillospira excrementavium]|nr:HAMP domain-containing histidine kinase [Candidatus Galloscillospira excrementavium]